MECEGEAKRNCGGRIYLLRDDKLKMMFIQWIQVEASDNHHLHFRKISCHKLVSIWKWKAAVAEGMIL